jgi:hypothetical protein
MTSPVVHIGFHKTATSWFQAFIYPNVASHRMIDRNLVRSIFMDSDAFDFDPKVARARLELYRDLTPPLICEEELSGVLHIGAASTYIAKEVASRLHATLPDAQIVIFVRAQADAAASWYMQYLKEGGTASARRYFFPDEYLFPGRLMRFKTARFDFSQLDYSGLVAAYDALFGRDRVQVFTYEDLGRDRDAVLADMQRRLGFDLGGKDLPAERVNTSLRRGLAPIARAFNLFTGRQVANKRTLIHVPFWFRARLELLEWLDAVPLFGPRSTASSVLDGATRRWIDQRFARSNRWLAERTGRNLAALGYGVADEEQPVPQPRRAALMRWARK